MKESSHSNWKLSLAQLLSVHNQFNADGSTSSHATRDQYSKVLFAGFKKLNELGFKLKDVKNFRGKHMVALSKEREKEFHAGTLSASTIQNRISIFRNFTNWLGKRGMVEGSLKYVSPECVKRTAINTVDKSWSDKGVNALDKIADVSAVDKWVGMQLQLAKAFGLRAKEAMMLGPHLADKGTYLEVTYGTKGGRPRAVPISTPEQREVLDLAKTFTSTKTSSISDPNRRLEQMKNHFYYVLRLCGISRQGGFTCHGLRHGYANQRYQELSSQTSPVQGGKLTNKEDGSTARKQIAEELGHSRESITNHYLDKDKGT